MCPQPPLLQLPLPCPPPHKTTKLPERKKEEIKKKGRSFLTVFLATAPSQIHRRHHYCPCPAKSIFPSPQITSPRFHHASSHRVASSRTLPCLCPILITTSSSRILSQPPLTKPNHHQASNPPSMLLTGDPYASSLCCRHQSKPSPRRVPPYPTREPSLSAVCATSSHDAPASAQPLCVVAAKPSSHHDGLIMSQPSLAPLYDVAIDSKLPSPNPCSLLQSKKEEE